MIESYSQIFQNLKKDIYSNVYLLMGEETFYIDKISNHIEDNFIDENLKSFNKEVLYGRDSNIKSIISSCNSFPMMSDKKLILVNRYNIENSEDSLYFLLSVIKESKFINEPFTIEHSGIEDKTLASKIKDIFPNFEIQYDQQSNFKNL